MFSLVTPGISRIFSSENLQFLLQIILIIYSQQFQVKTEPRTPVSPAGLSVVISIQWRETPRVGTIHSFFYVLGQ